MTPASRSPRIVVGYDASPASRAALARAANRAGADGRVYIVHAYSQPKSSIGNLDYGHVLDLELNKAQARGERLAEEASGDLCGVDWEVEVVGDRPSHAIAGAAAAIEADEIIVGSRGVGRARALLGSVAHEVIHLAHCPVTLIPERAVDYADERAEAPAPFAAGTPTPVGAER